MRTTLLGLLLGARPSAPIALFNAFREPEPALAAEWAAHVRRTVPGGGEALGNSALLHHKAADAFCRARAVGCTWAEYHTVVDHRY